ncbi:RsiV family protein [Bacillus massilinigeriensis]|uniref:RsiV family protein n=1 Tax=Bacillus mediterraneensis TaxID=1805474 RepID=UPI0008F885EE|nr:RsiV family protein [Bacillus mediterraneensis]
MKSDAYVEVLSKEAKKIMLAQMREDPNKVYWIKDPKHPEDVPIDFFEKIKPEQNFYINNKHQLVLVFDKYEVAPSYMGVVEITIDTKSLDDILVSKGYLK